MLYRRAGEQNSAVAYCTAEGMLEQTSWVAPVVCFWKSLDMRKLFYSCLDSFQSWAELRVGEFKSASWFLIIHGLCSAPASELPWKPWNLFLQGMHFSLASCLIRQSCIHFSKAGSLFVEYEVSFSLLLAPLWREGGGGRLLYQGTQGCVHHASFQCCLLHLLLGRPLEKLLLMQSAQ